jgi:hypothetical protein
LEINIQNIEKRFLQENFSAKEEFKGMLKWIYGCCDQG